MAKRKGKYSVYKSITDWCIDTPSGFLCFVHREDVGRARKLVRLANQALRKSR